ncbi:MAG TPA: 4-hydroxythreonine-4-phosphate dehydrogenase PdxA [Blastocatellia bacterium]|nr:4-hydroxythreonine-4-phosphate dehydrogenase PdxA [Blastocatellia bacterium]
MTRALSSPNKPRVGITIGDPAGIGPEIALKAVTEAEVFDVCSPVIIGDAAEIRRQARELGLVADFRTTTEDLLATDGLPGDLNGPLIFDTDNLDGPASWGFVTAAGGRAAVSAIEAAVKLCLAGKLDAMSTAPINKESINLAGSPFPGHTEMIASLCGVSQSLMCFFAEDLKVFLLTVHCSLAEAIRAISRERVVSAIRLADRELRRLGIARPRIAVAGLNPHAGEHGLFGSEETREIEPAIAECREQHRIEVSGPFPSDTLFVRAWRGEFDAVAACYHDQGLIAIKCLAFGSAVNVTLGLPIIRTSVDHGTAFDIAGRGVADHRSLVEAIKLAARLVRQTSACSSVSGPAWE